MEPTGVFQLRISFKIKNFLRKKLNKCVGTGMEVVKSCVEDTLSIRTDCQNINATGGSCYMCDTDHCNKST